MGEGKGGGIFVTGTKGTKKGPHIMDSGGYEQIRRLRKFPSCLLPSNSPEIIVLGVLGAFVVKNFDLIAMRGAGCYREA